MSITVQHPEGLYRPEFERENCGLGLIANMDDQASHWLVQTAITALTRMTHRGAVAADGKSGDGCGLLFKLPEAFLRNAAERSIHLGEHFAVGMTFLSPEETAASRARDTLETELRRENLVVSGWRTVPTRPEACGQEALKTLPRIEQIFVERPPEIDASEFERRLFVARRRCERALAGNDDRFCIASLSARVIAYKGLVMPAYLQDFYPDLGNSSLQSSVAVFHQRFSTNTLPQWHLAQPFRFLAHNGEINTIQGNRNWAEARSHKFETPLLTNLDELRPLVSMTGSDSCSRDNMLEVLLAGGMDIFRAMRLLIPPAWQNLHSIDPDLRAFYEYNSMHMESWDGPAGVVLTDGRHAACVLDRNGLRPARYMITRDRHITLASEIGVYDYEPEDVVAKGRLKPGQMLAADTQTGELLLPEDVDERLKSRHPYRQWLKRYNRRLDWLLPAEVLTSDPMDPSTLRTFQKLFQVTFEERDQILRPLAEAGQEAVGSMGDDAPFPVLSQRVRSLYDNFRQQFAQVTNPPIDPLRESIVMSLESCLGAERNMFHETPEHAERLVMRSPVLSEGKFRALLALDKPGYAHSRISLNYDPSVENLGQAVARIADEAINRVRAGTVILVLSDRGIARGRLPAHALLATGAVHHSLVAAGLRCDANIVVETGTARDPHHFAVLVGYGATAAYPYLAYECLHDMVRSGEIAPEVEDQLSENYRKGINKGLLKILSKMGISTVTSYRGAQLFEIVGLQQEGVERCFTGTTSRVEGAGFDDLEKDQARLAWRAFNGRKDVEQGGVFKYVHGDEYHAYNPDVVTALQTAVASGDYADYQAFASLVNERRPATLRTLCTFAETWKAFQ